MKARIETRTRDRIYCQTIRTVRDISRDDRAIIATCSLRTRTDRLKENCSIDNAFVVNDSHVLVVLVISPSGFREDLHGHNNAFIVFS